MAVTNIGELCTKLFFYARRPAEKVVAKPGEPGEAAKQRRCYMYVAEKPAEV